MSARHVPKCELTDRSPFIVWRAAPGTPPGWMPGDLEGRWDYRTAVQDRVQLPDPAGPPAHAIVVRTNRVEHRDDDGASAEVWEVHPVGGNYDPDPANRLPLW